MPRSRASRALRGLIGASIATFVALLSHVVADGAMPGWIGIAVPWVLSVMVCTLLAGRSLSLVRLSLGVIASQLLFHFLFVFGFIARSGASGAAQSAHGHHGHGAPGTMTLPPVSALPIDAFTGDIMMWISHGIAAIITIAALYRGERAVLHLRDIARGIIAWAARTLVIILPPPVRHARVRPTRISLRAPSAGPARSSLQRRGPPLCA